MLEGNYFFGEDNIEDAKGIRKLVFIEEQGMPETYEFDEEDKESVIVVAYLDKEPVATGRLLFDGINNLIGRIAVKKQHRRNNYGEFVVRMLIDKCINFGGNTVTVFAQENAVDFYKGMGFEVSGQPYIEDGINKYPMNLLIKNLVKKCNNM